MADSLIKLDKNSRQTLAALDKDTGEIRNLGMDEDAETLHVALWRWDTDTTAWVRYDPAQVEFTGDLTVTMSDVEALLSDHYYKRMKPYTHASGNPKYICKNEDIDANETDTDWIIWRYSDADVPTIEGPRTGAVNTEAIVDALSWVT